MLKKYLQKTGALVLASMLALLVLGMSACNNSSQDASTNSNANDVAAANEETAVPMDSPLPEISIPDPSKVTREIIIGTMVTEDILPMWVAESESMFADHGIKARVETFQSAQELSLAVASGSVDFAMTDPMVSASLAQSGTKITLHWVTLGATAEQGRFGIMANPESGVKTLADLAGKPIGVGSNTILEYVMDKLLEEAGVPQDKIVVEELKKIPVRYEMMTSNQVPAAALPGSLLALGEATGMVLVADDTKGANLSQSVMIARDDFTNTEEGATALAIVRAIWDEAVAAINKNPAQYRSLLIEKALSAMPPAVQESYPVSTYPEAAKPTNAMIDPVLDWMLEKGYLNEPLSYNQMTGKFGVAIVY
ncbi:MAG: ABC transporter substrate-binding protein [Coriobacteriales bacterium]|jgi:NitT/TauT family transport system substrate-binding protein|nr:ABC transporter substrate-binding protein [Coriobacteriales bacterium]